MRLFFARVAMLLALVSLVATAPVPAVQGEEEARAIRPSADTGATVPPETSLAATGHFSVPSEAPTTEGTGDNPGQSRPQVEAESPSSSKKRISRFSQKISSKLNRWWDPWQPAFSNREMEKLLRKLPEKPNEYQAVIEMTQDLPQLDGKKILTLGRNPSFDRSAILKMMNERQPFFVKGGKGKFWSFYLSSEAPDAHFIWTDKIPKDELSLLKEAALRTPAEATGAAEEAAGIAREGFESPGTATQSARSLEEATTGYTTVFPKPGAEAGGLSGGRSGVSPAAADQHSVAPEKLPTIKASETLPERTWQYPVRPGTLENDGIAEWRSRLGLKIAEKRFQPISSNYGMLTLIKERPQLGDSEADARAFLEGLPKVNEKPVLTLSGDPNRDRSAMALMTKEGEAFYVKGGRGKVWSFLRSTVSGQGTLTYTDQISEEELKLLKEATAPKLAEVDRAAREAAEGSMEATGGAREAAGITTEATTAEHSGVVSEVKRVDSLRPGMLDAQGRIIPKVEHKNLVPYRAPWYKPWSGEQGMSPANQRMTQFLDNRPLHGWTPTPVRAETAIDTGKILKLSTSDPVEKLAVTDLTKEGNSFYVVDQGNHVFRFKPKKDEQDAFTWTDDVKKNQKIAVKKALKDLSYRKKEAARQALKEQRLAAAAESSRPWLQKATENTGNFFKDLPKYIRAH